MKNQPERAWKNLKERQPLEEWVKALRLEQGIPSIAIKSNLGNRSVFGVALDLHKVYHHLNGDHYRYVIDGLGYNFLPPMEWWRRNYHFFRDKIILRGEKEYTLSELNRLLTFDQMATLIEDTFIYETQKTYDYSL